MDGTKICYCFILLVISLSALIMLGSPIIVQNNTTWVLFVVGFGTGLVGTIATVGLILLCLTIARRNDNTDGYTSHIFEYENPMAEVGIQTSNKYVVNNEKIIGPYALGVCRPNPETTQQGRVSACSDYTESHYYTEIDEYFINKRNEKLQARLQKRNANLPGVHADTTLSATSSQFDSTNVYDYAYGIKPHK